MPLQISCFNFNEMKKIDIRFLVLCYICLAILNSCGKKENPAPSGNNTYNGPKGTLFLHLHNYIDANEVYEYGIPYTNTYDRKIKLTMGQFYLSNFELIKLDGSTYIVPDSIVLKLQEQETFMVADVPVGNYKGISFHLGLDDKTDKAAPTLNSLLKRPDMWFGNTAQPNGYIFLNFQGTIDTTSDASASETEMVPFKYLLGTQAAYHKITMPARNYSVSPGLVEYVHLYSDYNQLFHGIDLRKKENLTIASPADNASAIATKMIANLDLFFSYEE